LNDQTIAALDASAALIVLCSPASARSRHVNEEIRLFKDRRPERRIVPVIVTGKPDDAAQECFPPALRLEPDEDGRITGRMAAPAIAADVREDGKGDGHELALAKVVASLIGVPPDEVVKRAERARKRQAIIRDAIAAGAVILACVAGYFAHRSREQTSVAAGTAATCASRLPAGQAAEGPQNALEQCITAAEGYQKDAPADPRDGETARLSNQGKPEEAEHPQVEATQNGGGGLDRTKNAAEDDQDAERLAKADPNVAGSERDLSISYEKSGDALAAKGALADALKAYRDSLVIVERLAKADPANAGWQRDLSIYNKVGDVLLAQGMLADALKTYQDGLAIAERLAKADAANAGWQRDLSICYEKVGDVLLAQGVLADALKTYRDGLAIAERLAKADPANAQWQRDLSVFHNKVGDVLVDKGAHDDALRAYREGLAIRERLIKTDPSNAGWLADLAASHGKLGQLLVRMDEKAEARRMFARGRAMVAPFAAKSGHQLWIGYLKAFDESLAALDKNGM
jgi:tetratricopeptide (TPR) repeat protein